MRIRQISLLLIFIFTLPLILSAQRIKSPKDLPEKHRKWLEEEVVYIISPKEKEVFLQLNTDKERDLFIEAFWKYRDPDPNTSENEFKTEHYRRVSYANNWFGKESPGPGWRSDMGRIYIILGEPKSIDKFENMTEIYPTIIWFYDGMAKYGLPSSFNVVFFKKEGIGEYELYSPIKFGPQQLLIHYTGDPTSYVTAYQQLLEIEPSIASISLSLIPGDSTSSISPSLASEILLGKKIPAAPYELINKIYAEKFLKYKDVVEVDYSTNYIDNDASVFIIQDKSGIFFVHYLVEPKKLSLEKVGAKYKTNLEINGKVSDLEENTIFQFERFLPIEFDEEQLNRIKDKLFSFQDMYPLVEGNYKFSLLLKNTASKEFTSVEANLSIPKAPSLLMTPLLLANRVIRDSDYKGKNKPFLIGDVQLVPSPRNDFSLRDTLYLYFQILGLTEDLKENGYLECSIFRDEKKIRSFIKNIKDFADQTNFIEEISLADLPAANYSLKVSLCNRNKEELLSKQTFFYISYLPYLLRPWVLSLPMPPSDNPIYANTLGIQFLNKNELTSAKSLLEEACRKNPNSARFALDFCRLLFLEKEYKKIKEIALPFLGDERKYEFLAIAGQSCQNLGEYTEAITHYTDYLAHYGMNINILNSLGECFYLLGNEGEALKAWQKSLEISPDQENIKTLIKSIKEKK